MPFSCHLSYFCFFPIRKYCISKAHKPLLFFLFIFSKNKSTAQAVAILYWADGIFQYK